MSADTVTDITGLESTYSAREAAALLGRSFSWIDQRIRNGDFVLPDGTTIQPLRAAAGYRYFTTTILRHIATHCYRHRWYSFDELKSVFRELAVDAHCETGECEVPSSRG
jgi:hypothetical protein